MVDKVNLIMDPKGILEDNNHKWTCPHCKKHFSKNYKYKKHLDKCLVYQSMCERQYDVLLEIKSELKQQFSDMFKDMILELKHDLLDSNQTVNVPIAKKKIIGNMFN